MKVGGESWCRSATAAGVEDARRQDRILVVVGPVLLGETVGGSVVMTCTMVREVRRAGVVGITGVWSVPMQ